LKLKDIAVGNCIYLTEPYTTSNGPKYLAGHIENVSSVEQLFTIKWCPKTSSIWSTCFSFQMAVNGKGLDLLTEDHAAMLAIADMFY